MFDCFAVILSDPRAVSAGRPSDVSDCADCNVNARCISSQGNTGRCVCKHGFVGDGKNCQGTSYTPFMFGAFFALENNILAHGRRQTCKTCRSTEDDDGFVSMTSLVYCMSRTRKAGFGTRS